MKHTKCPAQSTKNLCRLTGWSFQYLFSCSLLQSVAPTCFKRASLVPVPKKRMVTSLNDCRLVALTSTAMKRFAGLDMAHINSSLRNDKDPFNLLHRCLFSPHRTIWITATRVSGCCSKPTQWHSTQLFPPNFSSTTRTWPLYLPLHNL